VIRYYDAEHSAGVHVPFDGIILIYLLTEEVNGAVLRIEPADEEGSMIAFRKDILQHTL
jgi:hypothetical protein